MTDKKFMHKPCGQYDLWPLRTLPSIVYALHRSQVFSMLCLSLQRPIGHDFGHFDFCPDAPKSINCDIVF